MTLDPGHFHAALVQKTMYSKVDTTAYVYAPEGGEVQSFLSLVDGFNAGEQFQTLLGVTGSGKTFTIANVIQQIQLPTLQIRSETGVLDIPNLRRDNDVLHVVYVNYRFLSKWK